jgi:hypothetical protein
VLDARRHHGDGDRAVGASQMCRKRAQRPKASRGRGRNPTDKLDALRRCSTPEGITGTGTQPEALPPAPALSGAQPALLELTRSGGRFRYAACFTE